jgi:hypothetical protein
MRAILAVVVALGHGAVAQVVVAPDSLRVVMLQGQEATTTLILHNAGGAVPYCLDFSTPMQRRGVSSLGGCGIPGELLGWADESSIGFSWDPYAVTMTPDGRVFVAEFVGSRRTYELTPSLLYVTRFQSPTVAELAIPFTVGITYNEDTGTLWWTNAEVDGHDVLRILLLEGTLEGVATGRRIEVPVPPTGPPPFNTGHPVGAAYDPATKRYYYLDAVREELWAIDTLGAIPIGYPRRLDAYPSAYLGNGVDAFGGVAGGPEGVRLEIPVGLFLDLDYDRVVVTDTLGTNLATETSLGAIWAEGWYPMGSTARSRLDPNGMMYATFSGGGPGEPDGVAAIRPVPLAPTWLVVTDWSGTIPAGGTSQITLTFRAGQREPGEYRSTLVVEDTAGVEMASVPLTLVVEPATPANEPGAGEAGVSIAVAPNPLDDAGAVTVTLARPASDARVSLYDVLGREVETLHAASLQAGATRLALPARLPAGVYVVRVDGGGLFATARFSVVR